MNLAFFAGPPGLPEVLVVLFVFVLLFGAKKLPDLARSMGRSLSEFKKGKALGRQRFHGSATLSGPVVLSQRGTVTAR